MWVGRACNTPSYYRSTRVGVSGFSANEKKRSKYEKNIYKLLFWVEINSWLLVWEGWIPPNLFRCRTNLYHHSFSLDLLTRVQIQNYIAGPGSAQPDKPEALIKTMRCPALQAAVLGDYNVMLAQKVPVSIWDNFCLASIALNSRSRPGLILWWWVLVLGCGCSAWK